MGKIIRLFFKQMATSSAFGVQKRHLITLPALRVIPRGLWLNPVVTGITVDAGKDTVLVQVSANLERLFPSVVPEVIVTESGDARVRAFTR